MHVTCYKYCVSCSTLFELVYIYLFACCSWTLNYHVDQLLFLWAVNCFRKSFSNFKRDFLLWFLFLFKSLIHLKSLSERGDVLRINLKKTRRLTNGYLFVLTLFIKLAFVSKCFEMIPLYIQFITYWSLRETV